MPVEKRYNINDLKTALKFYTEKTGKRVTIEYILIGKLMIQKIALLNLHILWKI